MKSTVFAYVCAPCSQNRGYTVARFRDYACEIFDLGYIPIAPNLMFSTFLRDSIPEEREARRHMAQQLLRRCRMLVVCGENVTEEMEAEIMLAKRLGIVSTTLDGLQTISEYTQEEPLEE